MTAVLRAEHRPRQEHFVSLPLLTDWVQSGAFYPVPSEVAELYLRAIQLRLRGQELDSDCTVNPRWLEQDCCDSHRQLLAESEALDRSLAAAYPVPEDAKFGPGSPTHWRTLYIDERAGTVVKTSDGFIRPDGTSHYVRTVIHVAPTLAFFEQLYYGDRRLILRPLYHRFLAYQRRLIASHSWILFSQRSCKGCCDEHNHLATEWRSMIELAVKFNLTLPREAEDTWFQHPKLSQNWWQRLDFTWYEDATLEAD